MLLNIVEKGGSEDSGNATSMMTNDEKYEPIVELVIEDRDELQEKLQEQVTMQTIVFNARNPNLHSALCRSVLTQSWHFFFTL